MISSICLRVVSEPKNWEKAQKRAESEGSAFFVEKAENTLQKADTSFSPLDRPVCYKNKNVIWRELL